MRAEHLKSFLAEHADDRRKQAIITGECGPANTGEHFGAIGIRPDIQQRRTPHRTDQHQIQTAMVPQGAEDAAHCAHAMEHMRPWRDHAALGEAFQPDDEHGPAGGSGGSGDTTRQRATSGQDTQSAWRR